MSVTSQYLAFSPMVNEMIEVPHVTPAKQAGRNSIKIPRILFQTFKSREIPEGMWQASETWRTLNPEYEYRFFGDEECRAMIQTHFGQEAARAFDSIREGAFRADFWRYCALYVEGGVYADIDTVCKRPLRDLINEDDEFIAPRDHPTHALNNAFLVAAPGHPFLDQVINNAISGLSGCKECNVKLLVGCPALGDAVNSKLGRIPGTRYGFGVTTGNGMKVRVLRQYFSLLPNRGRVMDGRHTILINHYPGYHDDLSSAGVAYWLPGAGVKRNLLKATVRRVPKWFRANF